MTSSAPARLTFQQRQLVLHAVLITLIVIGTVMRMWFPFVYNPLESMWSDPARHYHNAFDVKGEDLESILNAPGYEVFLSTVVRFTGQNRFLIGLVFALLSAATPYLWYRWLRELTRNKTMSLIGYAAFVYLPSYFRIFGYFMDSVILLPLIGAALWLAWRAARKGTWGSIVLAGVAGGAACCTKSTALPVVVLAWLFVIYDHLARNFSRRQALQMVAAGVGIVLCFFGLGPFKVWTHMDCFVLLPDGLYNQRYFESCAHDIQVTSRYRRLGDGDFVAVSIWGSSSVVYPPFYPFSNWMTSRRGRYTMDLDYMHGRDYTAPIHMALRDRLRMIWENIIFFFFEYQWPEDNDWQDPFPRSLPTAVRFAWLPLTLFVTGYFLWKRRRDRVGWYFIVVTLAFMFQQSAVMEGRYKKAWEGMALGIFFYVMARTEFYRKRFIVPASATAEPTNASPVPSDDLPLVS